MPRMQWGDHLERLMRDETMDSSAELSHLCRFTQIIWEEWIQRAVFWVLLTNAICIVLLPLYSWKVADAYATKCLPANIIFLLWQLKRIAKVTVTPKIRDMWDRAGRTETSNPKDELLRPVE